MKAEAAYSGQETVPITDDEKVEVEKAKGNLLGSIEVVAQDEGGEGEGGGGGGGDGGGSVRSDGDVVREGMSEQDEVSGAGVEGGNEGEQEVDKREEVIIKRLEAAQKDNIETQQRMASLTQTMTVLSSTPSSVESSNVIPPVSEVGSDGGGRGGGGGGGGGEMVSTASVAGDSSAQAAALGAGGDGRGDSDEEKYEEAVQPTDAGASVGEIHVVGEILGGKGFLSAAVDAEADQTESTATKQGVTVESAHTLDDHISSTVEPSPASQIPNTDTAQLTPSHSIATDQQDSQLTTSQAAHSQPAGVSAVKSFSSLPSTGIPSTAIKTSRPKRQLAASFTRDTS